MLEKVMKHKKILVMSMVLCLALSSFCFAASGDLSSGLDFSPIVSAITDKITPTDIITVIAAVVGAGMAFVLAWFGIRKVGAALRDAITKGKLRVG